MARNDLALDPVLIGSNLRLLRERIYEITQEEMADACGVSRSTLRRVEDGQQLPALELIQRAGRIDENLTYLTDHLCNRRFSEFGIDLLIAGGIYQRALERSSDEFIASWYTKVAADLRVLSSSVREAQALAQHPDHDGKHRRHR